MDRHDPTPSPEGPVFVGRLALPCGPMSRAAVTHAFSALSFHTGGTARFEQRGAWTLEPGDVLIVPAGEPHRMLASERPERWGVGFCAPCFPDDVATLLAPFERVREGASPVVRVPEARRAFFASLFSELASASAERGEGALAAQRSLLTLIVREVDRASHDNGIATLTSGVVTEALRVIERRCLGPLSLGGVADAIGRTPSYVTTALTRATGRSAVAWIIAGRMAEARRLLLHSDVRVDDVAARVGYADPTHFIRLFRREHGVTPAAWRAARSRAAE
ncbi:MAG: AraC family transcriptional regulator [Polyangiales bacterium]